MFLHSYCFKKLDRQTLAVFNDVPLLFNISADWLLCFEQRNSGTWDNILGWRQANGVHIANSMYSTAVLSFGPAADGFRSLLSLVVDLTISLIFYLSRRQESNLLSPLCMNCGVIHSSRSSIPWWLPFHSYAGDRLARQDSNLQSSESKSDVLTSSTTGH